MKTQIGVQKFSRFYIASLIFDWCFCTPTLEYFTYTTAARFVVGGNRGVPDVKPWLYAGFQVMALRKRANRLAHGGPPHAFFY